jgi:hypothetical protein
LISDCQLFFLSWYVWYLSFYRFISPTCRRKRFKENSFPQKFTLSALKIVNNHPSNADQLHFFVMSFLSIVRTCTYLHMKLRVTHSSLLHDYARKKQWKIILQRWLWPLRVYSVFVDKEFISKLLSICWGLTKNV